jgi:2-polyprenyl-3-methyl-5-hydroxy-6-metoxy-1,4-benzoquinol methylase
VKMRSDVYELFLYAVNELGLASAHRRLRKLRGQNVDHLYQRTLASRFTGVYRNRVWLNERETGSLSGLGSELACTESIRKSLPAVLRSLGTEVLVDVGCGDFTWMKELSLACRYIGVDIVTHLIEENTQRYASETRTFQVLDATTAPLPAADTVLCREVLFHLSFADIRRLIGRVERCGARHLIATIDRSVQLNADIASGDFRRLNLMKAPFRFPAPLMSLADDGVSEGRALAVWRVADLPLH